MWPVLVGTTLSRGTSFCLSVYPSVFVSVNLKATTGDINQCTFLIQDKNIRVKCAMYNESDKRDVLMLQRN